MAGFFDDFATGFAAGFVPAYDASVKRTEARKESEFKTALQSWQDQLKNYNSARSEDSQRLRDATDVVTELGVSPSAIPNVYNWLRQGRTMENIRDDLQSGSFRVLQPENETTPSVTVGSTDAAPFSNDAQASVEGAGLDSQTNAMLGQPINFVYTDYAANQGRTGSPLEGQRPELIAAVSNAFKSLEIESIGVNSAQRGENEVNHNGNAFDIDVSQYGPEQRAEIITALSENGIRGIGVGNNTIHADMRGERNRFWWYDANGEQTGTMPEALSWSADAINAHFDRTVPTGDGNGQVIDPGASTDGDGQGSPELTAANERTITRLTEQLGISREYYTQVMRGYSPTNMTMTMGFVPAPDEENIPDYMDLSKIRRDNYQAFAAAARAGGNETQAVAIETLGLSMQNPEGPAKYLEYETMTTSNAEGRLLAAQRDNNQEAITTIQGYIADQMPEQYKDYASLTISNARGRLIAAQIANDQDTVQRISEYIFANDNQIPDQITKAWVGGRYTRLALAAAQPNASPQAQAALQVFRQTELPIYIEAMRLIPSEDTNRPTTLIEAYDALRDLKAAANPDQEAIQAAEDRIDQLLNLEVADALARNSGDQVKFIKVNEDGSFETTTGYVRPGGADSPDTPTYVNSAGEALGDGYRVIDETELNRGQGVITGLTTEIRNYNTNKRGALRAVRLAGDLVTIVQDEPRVLTTTANIAAGGTSLFREMNTAIDIAGRLMGSNDQVSLVEYERELRSQGLLAEGESLTSLSNTPPEQILSLGTQTERIARQTRIFNAKILLMAFRSGGLEGQSGQAMSNKDFERLSIMINASSDADTFSTALVSYVNDSVQSVRDEWGDLNTHDAITAFQSARGWNPLGDGTVGVSIDTQLTSDNADARLVTGYRILEGDFQLIPPRVEGSGSTGNGGTEGDPQLMPIEQATAYINNFANVEGSETQMADNLLKFFVDNYGIDAVPESMKARAQTLMTGNQ
jgi:hypothetical protein